MLDELIDWSKRNVPWLYFSGGTIVSFFYGNIGNTLWFLAAAIFAWALSVKAVRGGFVELFTVIAKFLRPLASRVARSVVAGAGKSLSATGSWFKSAPVLGSSLILAVIAIWQFAVAFINWDAGTPFHFGMLALACSATLCVIHFDGHTKVVQLVEGNLAWTWLIASFSFLAVSAGHGWWGIAFWSGVSLACAAITLAKGWRTPAKGCGIIVEKIFKAVSGGHGCWVAVTTVAALSFSIGTGTHLAGQKIDLGEGWLVVRNISLTIGVLCIMLGWGIPFLIKSTNKVSSMLGLK